MCIADGRNLQLLSRSGIRIPCLRPHTGTVNVAYHNPPVSTASAHRDHPRPASLKRKWSFSEGIISTAGTFTGWLYLALAHSISGITAWLLFVFALASFILSIFASVKQSRW